MPRSEAPAASATVLARWIVGPSARGSLNGHADLDRAGAAVDERLEQVGRLAGRRVAAGQVGHEDDLIRPGRVAEGVGVAAHATPRSETVTANATRLKMKWALIEAHRLRDLR